jgi:hypothetical protein
LPVAGLTTSAGDAGAALFIEEEVMVTAAEKIVRGKQGQKSKTGKSNVLVINAPNFQVAKVQIIGTSPLMLHRFSKKAEIQAKHEAGSQESRSRGDKPPRDFEAEYEAARYRDVKAGWDGFSASSIRGAMISACRTTGTVMTRAKLAVFIEADGIDEDMTPLVRIYGDPVMDIRRARNDDGSLDLRARPRFDEWHATLRIRFDAGMISTVSVANLLMRVGMQVGIGEGRPDSRKSPGIGYGLFNVMGEVPA